LGTIDKKFRIRGKLLSIREIEFQFDELFSFLKQFLSADETFEVHTSGSTGTPKLITIPKKYMRASAQKTVEALQLKKGDKALLCLPLDKIGGIMMLVRWLEADLDLYPESVEANPLKDNGETFDFAAMVPYQVASSINEIPRVKKLIIGGAPVSAELEQQLMVANTAIYHTYGMTETISHIALRPIADEEANVYTALPGVYLAVDERHCLTITAPDIGVEALATNDVVELIDGSHFIWKGRFDNVINSGGIKMLPEEIEKKLGDIGLPYFLFGEPDDKLGQRLVLMVQSESIPKLQGFERFFKRVSRYEAPKAIYAVPEFVVAGSGKINRKATIDLLQ
jgi:O-succinylbenzoic acid--CoA ligase